MSTGEQWNESKWESGELREMELQDPMLPGEKLPGASCMDAIVWPLYDHCMTGGWETLYKSQFLNWALKLDRKKS